MIVTFLFFLAGMFNAVMDTVKDHYAVSIFTKIRASNYIHFWLNEAVAWRNKYTADSILMYLKWNDKTVLKRNKKPITITSAWHLSKSLMLVCISLAVALSMLSSEKIFPFLVVNYFIEFNFWVYLAIYYVWARAWFGLGFYLFYNHILIK